MGASMSSLEDAPDDAPRTPHRRPRFGLLCMLAIAAVAPGCATVESDEGPADATSSDTSAPTDSDDGDACVAADETCNAEDDDCDGVVDEALSRACGSSVGACEAGTETCELGAWSSCDGRGAPGATPEACEGEVDEDCDGAVDEGCDCTDDRPCGTAAGRCLPGTQLCEGGTLGACIGAVLPAPETCDGTDDDCDGADDEGLSRPCGSDVGRCTVGEARCESGEWTDCDGARGPTPESCDAAEDEDCDGEVDEGCACAAGSERPCGVDTGACRVGSQRCAAGRWGGCEGAVEPAPERCDGADLDCDGRVDEGCACAVGEARPCGSAVGACESGAQGCLDGVFGECVGGRGPEMERCGNGEDEDCDGAEDEGCCDDGRAPPCAPTPDPDARVPDPPPLDAALPDPPPLDAALPDAAPPVPDGYGPWGPWGPCEGGRIERSRTCGVDGFVAACELCGGLCRASAPCAGDPGECNTLGINVCTGTRDRCDPPLEGRAEECDAPSGCQWDGPRACEVGGSVSNSQCWGGAGACVLFGQPDDRNRDGIDDRAQNMLPNGDFNVNLDGWDGPGAWVEANAGDDARSGSLRIRLEPGADALTHCLAVQPRARLQVGAWAASLDPLSDVAPRIDTVFFRRADCAGDIVGRGSVAGETADGAWHLVQMPFRVHHRAESVRIELRWTETMRGGSDLLFDGVRLLETPDAR
jgi:hypothetical protein